jgi:hypothetical protein
MTRIGRHPAIRSLRFIVIVCVIGGFLLGAPLTRITDGEVPYPVGVALSIALLLALILGLTAIMYRPVAWDPGSGTVSLAGRTVALSSITRVVRVLSTGNGAGYLTYRFYSTDGPSARVLVAGRPMRGLVGGEIDELLRLVEAAPIADPVRADGLSGQQAALADTLSETGGKSEVGKRLLVEELQTMIGARSTVPTADGEAGRANQLDASGAPVRRDPDPAAPPIPAGAGVPLPDRPRMSQREAEELERRWEEDDADATRFLASRPAPFRTIRPVLILLIVVAALLSGVALVIAVVAENARGSLLGDDNDLASLAIVGPGLLGVVLYMAWCAAADAQVRHKQRTAHEWLATRDDGQRQRGLAAPLLAAWGEPAPGTRLARALGFAGSTLGGLAFLVGLVLFFTEDETGPVVAATFVLVGGAVLTAGTVGIVWSYRRRRTANRELVLLAGWRLDPPFVSE